MLFGFDYSPEIKASPNPECSLGENSPLIFDSIAVALEVYGLIFVEPNTFEFPSIFCVPVRVVPVALVILVPSKIPLVFSVGSLPFEFI